MNQITIQTPTPSIAESIQFYEKLGFRKINNSDRLLYTDGKIIIEINNELFARLGLRMYNKTWIEETGNLKENHTTIDLNEGYLTRDPNGIWIYLIESDFIAEDVEEISFSKLGNYAGVSIETISMESSLDFYQNLGFTITAGSVDNPWMTLSHPCGFSISFMKPLSCPHLFFNPSLTYFNGGNNPSIIKAIRSEGIPITEEITHFSKTGEVDNIIIRDPGGLGFFIFND